MENQTRGQKNASETETSFKGRNRQYLVNKSKREADENGANRTRITRIEGDEGHRRSKLKRDKNLICQFCSFSYFNKKQHLKLQNNLIKKPRKINNMRKLIAIRISLNSYGQGKIKF